MPERVLIGTFHPAELLQEELETRGWSVKQFARRLGMDAGTVQEVLDAKRDITSEMAVTIGEVLGTGPELWLPLQYQSRPGHPPRRL